MGKRNFYKILGIEKDATEIEIKKAYRRLAIKFHPDKNPGNKDYEDRFLEVAAAYEVLSDEKKRKEYNNLLFSSGINVQWNIFDVYNRSFDGFSNLFTDVYNDFLGFYNQTDIRSKRKGSDIKLKTDITIHQAAFGMKKTIEFEAYRKCASCNGTGAPHKKDTSICLSCKGSGIIEYEHGFFRVQRICRECEGEGAIIINPCNECKGNGRVVQKLKSTFKIPPGVEEESSLRFANKGNAGICGGHRGNLYLQINIAEDKFFKRDGNNIRCEVPISFAQAALGANISVPTLDGKKEIRIPSGTQSGKEIEIKGNGIIGKNSRRGSQFVKLIVTTPKKLSKKEKALFLELDKSEKR